MKLQGIFAEITTPFDYSGAIYKTKIQHNAEKWNRVGLAGYLVCGLAGEGPMLTAEEKSEVWELAARHALPERVLIAGIQAESVRETVALIERASGAGYQAAMVESPGCYRYSVEEHATYFRAVADRVPIPVIARGVFSHPNIVEARLATDPGTLWSALQSGASGAALAFASAAPYACISIWEAHRTREEDAGRELQARILHAAELVSASVPALKHAMDLNGYYGGPPRLPLTTCTPAMKSSIEEAFRELRG